MPDLESWGKSFWSQSLWGIPVAECKSKASLHEGALDAVITGVTPLLLKLFSMCASQISLPANFGAMSLNRPRNRGRDKLTSSVVLVFICPR
jgi:hypothetical protein